MDIENFYTFQISETNCFKLLNPEEAIWLFYKNKQPTDFHIIGNPHEDFRNADLDMLDRYSCDFAEMHKQAIYAGGLNEIMRDLFLKNTDFGNSLEHCSIYHSLIEKQLKKHSAYVPEKKIKQYIRNNIL